MGSPRKQPGRGMATRRMSRRSQHPPTDENESPLSTSADRRTPSPRARRSRSRSDQRRSRSRSELRYGGSLEIPPFDPKEMRSDAYIANFEATISTYFREGDVSDYYKKQLFFDALSSQQRNAIGCQMFFETFESLIEAFRSVYDVSIYDAFTELTNIRMREGESIVVFANRYKRLLPAENDPDHNFIKHHFISKLPIEVQRPWAVRLYYEKKSFIEIAKECNKVYKHLLQSRSNKRSRDQDDSEEEEQGRGDQAAVNLVDDTSRQRREKRAKTDQEPASAAAAFAAAVCRPHKQFGPRAWRCLGNGCPFENAPGFLTKRGPGQRNGRGRGQGNGRGRGRN